MSAEGIPAARNGLPLLPSGWTLLIGSGPLATLGFRTGDLVVAIGEQRQFAPSDSLDVVITSEFARVGFAVLKILKVRPDY